MAVRLIATLVLFGIQAAYAAPSDDLHELFDEYWANEMAEDPFSATGAGVFDYNDQVPSVTPADEVRRAEEAEDFLSRLRSIDREALSAEDRLNADLLDFILKHRVALSEFDGWRIPFLADAGFHTRFGYVVSATAFRAEKDYTDYLTRLRALPGYFDQQIENMRQGLADGFTQPKEILPYILPSFEAQVKDNAAAHPYYAPFNDMPQAISQRRQSALRREANDVLSNDVIPAFARLLAFMKDEYIPAARDTLGASDLPNGEAYYAALVRYYTTLDDATADEIHELGLREVARIRGEMNDVIKETGFKGDFAEFLEFLRTDRQFYAKTPQGLLDRAAWIAKDIDGRLPAFFGKLPRQPYSVEPVPADIAPNYTNARYVGASLDANRGGQFWVNTYNHEIRPLYQLTAMALHEGVPGHHFQNALALEIENVPTFRTEFYPHAFGEGWGLYAEKLGVEMGVYQTPYDHFGRLTWEMWRACRLVIDTGLHTKGWTRQQAIDYLASNTALSLHNVQTEVDRYISWPGQALAYKMGELTIWELRRKAERELGDKFDIREFHDAVVAEGGLPLVILRARIGDYIAETKRNNFMNLTGLTAAPVIETERLRLRGRTADDFAFINAMWSDPTVTRYIGGKPRSEEDNWTKFLRMIGHWPVMGYGYWIVEERESGEALGEAGFGEFKRDMTPSIKGEPELGYAFTAPSHGKGYGGEAVRAVVDWGDKHFRGARMSCIIDEGNVASVRVAEKCGFKLSGRAVYHGEEILLLHR